MNRRNAIIIISILAFIMIIGGISYSYFVYNKDVGNVSLDTGDISISLSGVSANRVITNAVPKKDNNGKISSDYFDWTVNATVETERIYYEVYLMPESGNTLNTNYLKTYLTDQNNNEIKEVTIYNDLSDSKVENGKVLYKGIIEVKEDKTSKNETKDFRLRLWIDENYQEASSKTFAFDIFLYAINVSDDFSIPSLRNEIASKVGSANYVASYDDIIQSNPTFTTQDQVSTSATRQTVYYYTGNSAAANSNVLFAGYCWQIIRTTDNGGVRMIYNGVAVNNKCETTRTVTKGINADGNGTTQSMSAAILYGRSYDYDLDTGIFTIEDSNGLPTAWNDTNYKELIGTYTCLSSSSTCTTLYYVGSINQDDLTQAYVAKYTIGNVAHFSQLGTSVYNSNYNSPAFVGYMFNTKYDYKRETKSGEYYTNAVWENGAYVLSNGNNGTAPDATHHYICDDNDCTRVRYYYYAASNHYYILLENGVTVEGALKEMINYKVNANDSDENINVYNSAMKGYLDNWYKKNLTAYTSYLDGSSVYCNDRSISNLGGWNPSGTSLTTLQFYQYNANRNLNCVNETDRFSVTNNKAKLTYPIGLLTEPERDLMTKNFAATGKIYWGASPYHFFNTYATVRYVVSTGSGSLNSVYVSSGARPVISLKPDTEFSSGTGAYTEPYIVGPIVQRTN